MPKAYNAPPGFELNPVGCADERDRLRMALVSAEGQWVGHKELAALRKDAERYRWLKRNPTWLGWEHDFRPDEVERAIDAAMASEAVRAA